MNSLALIRTHGCRVLLLALLLSFGAGAHAQVDEATAEMLMRKSGMWQQFAELSTQIRTGFRQSTEKAPKAPSAEEVARLDRAIGAGRATGCARLVRRRDQGRAAGPAPGDAAELRPLLIASFSLSYRDVPQNELSPYVAFLKSDVERHFNDVSLESMFAVGVAQLHWPSKTVTLLS